MQFKPAHFQLWRQRRLFISFVAQNSMRIFSQLMHVDHVSDRSNFMECLQRSLAFVTSFQRQHKENRCPDQHDIVNARFGQLNYFRQAVDH